jgi:hypothetical protein
MPPDTLAQRIAGMKAAAEKAITPQSLMLIRYDHGGGRLFIEDGDNRDLIADFYDEANREYYARVDPASVLALIAEVERLREIEAQSNRAVKTGNWGRDG